MVTNPVDPDDSLPPEWRELLNALPPMRCARCREELDLDDLEVIPYLGLIHAGCAEAELDEAEKIIEADLLARLEAGN